MSLVIEIKSQEVKVRQGTSKRTGEIFNIPEQEAWIHNGKAYPERIKLTMPRGQNHGYPPGRYTISPDSFYPDRFGSLACTPKLVPLSGAQQQPQAKAS